MIVHITHRKFYLTYVIGLLLLVFIWGFSAQPSFANIHANVDVNVKETGEPNTAKILSFEQAIKAAQTNDPWLTGNLHQQRAIESMSIAANTLPDPKVTLSLANLPTNGFDFSQEGMTQAKIGIAQVFPRGDTLSIKSEQLSIESEAFVLQRQDRVAKVAVTVGSLWLDAFRVQQSIALINKNSMLFEQLADVAQASYSSALGKTRQQDIVRAQLELTRLEDRLGQLAQQQNHYQGMLSQWLTQFAASNESTEGIALNTRSLQNTVLSQQLPKIALTKVRGLDMQSELTAAQLVHYLSKHPAVVAIDKKIGASNTGIKLAEQKYQSQWGVNASYGYRADDAMGSSRADLFSIGVSFDLPLFTKNKQDRTVQSAIFKTEAVKTKKLLLLRQLIGAYSSAKGRLQQLKERQALYLTRLLPQIHDQAEASLTAYTNDDGDFAEVVRARIAVLNAEIEQLALNVEQQKLHLELNYLFLASIDGTAKPMTLKQKHDMNSGQHTTTSGEK